MGPAWSGACRVLPGEGSGMCSTALDPAPGSWGPNLTFLPFQKLRDKAVVL